MRSKPSIAGSTSPTPRLFQEITWSLLPISSILAWSGSPRRAGSGGVEDFNAEGEREAPVFTLWLNSLGVEPGVYNLFQNIKDGLIILQAFYKIQPGLATRNTSTPQVKRRRRHRFCVDH